MRKKRHSPKILTPDEEKKLLVWTHQNRSLRDYLAILTVLGTGLRATELRVLLVSDICDDKEIVSVLEVRPEIAHDRQRRTISLPHDLREQLKAFINWKRQRGESVKPTSFLFASAKSPQITVRHLQRIVRESTVGALGVPYRIGDLRRVTQVRHKKDAETTFSDVSPSDSEQSPTSSDPVDSTQSDIETVPIKYGTWRTYDVTNGLAGQVRCMQQDSRGYLWIGTFTGLCRYDGAEFTTYTTDDGLADNRIEVIYEDHQRRLWFGTPAGVSCYNPSPSPLAKGGIEGGFVTYTTDNGLADNHVTAICEDRHSRMWFGTREGVSCFDGRNFTTYTTEDGLADNRVRQIHQDRQGRLWFATGPMWPDKETGWGVTCVVYPSKGSGRGAEPLEVDPPERSRRDGQRFVTYTTADGLADDNVRGMYEDRQGRLWFCTVGGVSCFDGAEFHDYTTADGLVDDNVQVMCEDRQGRLWFGTAGGVSCFDGVEFRNYTTADGLAANHVNAICEDRQGRLWFSFGFPHFGRTHGVSCFNGRVFTTYTVKDGLLDNRSRVMFQDAEGYLWLSHHLSGLSRFDPETLELLTTQHVGLSLIQDRQEAFWFGDGKMLYRLKAQQLRCQTFNVVVYRILEDSRGNLWVGTWGDGLYRYDSPDEVWCGEGQRFTTEDGLGSNDVFALLEARDGTIWVGTGGNPACLCRFDGEVSSEARSRSIGAFEAMPTPHTAFWHLFEDRRGRIWMSDWSGTGLSCYDVRAKHASPLRTYTTKDGLPSNHVKQILEDDSGHLWIGTWEGLCRFDGKRFVTYGRDEGLKSLFHQPSAKDAGGHLWFGTLGGGLYRTDGKHFQWLTEADGLPSNNIMGLVPQPDGSMIIGTTSGIVRYRATATTPPPIEIREVVADRVYRQPTVLELTATESAPQVSPMNRDASTSEARSLAIGAVPQLIISYHGLSLATRQMRYSYILEGYDPPSPPLSKGGKGGWQDTWENQVRYENLPPGEYTFLVIAINRDLIPSETPATVKITVVPDERDVKIATLQTAVNQLRREVGSKYQFSNIIGRSAAIKQVYTLMERAIDSGLNVLISGDTGTGKELVAKAIHYNSSRKDQSLLDLNCGGLPRDLIAGHLFGHRKGTFTGATEDKAGLFELASGGTVILDEIGEMPLDAQPNLLRVLQERAVQRIGEYTSRDVDVRLIAMTNRNLLKEVEAGRFREDLYYRLNEFPIHIPPLRERTEDIPPLAAHFYEEYCRERNKALDGFAPDVFEMLSNYPWPGNVRELRNEIRRACALVEDGLRVETYHFPPQITRGESLIQEILSEEFTLPAAEDQFQHRMIEDALRQCDSNRTQAAKMLGIDRRSLYERMKRLDIQVVKREK